MVIVGQKGWSVETGDWRTYNLNQEKKQLISKKLKPKKNLDLLAKTAGGDGLIE
jgi:hypothetical protein